MEKRFRVKDDYVSICRFYGSASGEYVSNCQENGIPKDDLQFMIDEYGEDEIMSLLEEF